MMEYKITPKNQFKALTSLIYGTILFSFIIYFFIQNENYSTELVPFGYICYFVWLMPALFVHIEYYLINKRDVVVIDLAQKTVSINSLEPAIEKIILVMTPVLYRNGALTFTPWDSYHYGIIKMKDGGQFVFTSLMAPKVKEAMKQINNTTIEKKRSFIPSPLLLRGWHYLWD